MRERAYAPGMIYEMDIVCPAYRVSPRLLILLEQVIGEHQSVTDVSHLLQRIGCNPSHPMIKKFYYSSSNVEKYLNVKEVLDFARTIKSEKFLIAVGA